MLSKFSRKMVKFKTYQKGNLYVARAYYPEGVQVEVSSGKHSLTRFFRKTIFTKLFYNLWIIRTRNNITN
jgi:hypothetical protein